VVTKRGKKTKTEERQMREKTKREEKHRKRKDRQAHKPTKLITWQRRYG
jgi:hypothetical protein